MGMVILLMLLAGLWPLVTEGYWFDILVHIREAIHSGDSGKLVLASASSSVLMAVPDASLCLALLVMSGSLWQERSDRFKRYMSVILSYLAIMWLLSIGFGMPWEPVTSMTALAVTVFLIEWSQQHHNNLMPSVLIAIQVFFAAQWFNVMPVFKAQAIGFTDIPVSIKIVGSYLNGQSVLNYMGLSFVIPLVFSSVMTALLFRTQAQNIRIVEESYEKARALETMQAKVMENRLYQETNALAHDLKTPLVTIRGLNSLLGLSKDLSKIESYSERIESAVSKMNEMISSFLYGTSRQTMDVDTLLNYIRAQIPIEDDALQVTFYVADGLPMIHINKVRVARALTNVLENAMLAPHTTPEKKIFIRVEARDEWILIHIIDNGLGIPEEEIDKVWLIGHSSKNTSGLGLPFAKQIIQENDGTIVLESKLGVGTKVTISLPAVMKEKRSNREESH